MRLSIRIRVRVRVRFRVYYVTWSMLRLGSGLWAWWHTETRRQVSRSAKVDARAALRGSPTDAQQCRPEAAQTLLATSVYRRSQLPCSVMWTFYYLVTDSVLGLNI